MKRLILITSILCSSISLGGERSPPIVFGNPIVIDLESHLYDLSASSQILAEMLGEDGVEGELYTTALQLQRNTSRIHESLLRGTTLQCLRNNVSRIEFHIHELFQQCDLVSNDAYISYVEELDGLANIVVRDITELELEWGLPSESVDFWQCESGGYKFTLYFDGYIGRAIDKNLAIQRSLNSCETSPKILRRCAISQCVLRKS